MIVTKQHIRYGRAWVNPNLIKNSREGNRIKAELNRMARRVAHMEAQRIEIEGIEYLIDVKANFIGKIV